jgi:hypothetical protein
VRFSHLVAELYRRGVSYWPTPEGRLHLEAPEGSLTPELREALHEHRDSLLFLSDRTPIMGRGRDDVEEREDKGDAREDQEVQVTTGAANRTGAALRPRPQPKAPGPSSAEGVGKRAGDRTATQE